MALKNLVRFQLNLPPDMHEYYKNEADRMGVSMSAMIVMDLRSSMEQKEALKRMGDLDGLVKRMEQLQQMVSEEKKRME